MKLLCCNMRCMGSGGLVDSGVCDIVKGLKQKAGKEQSKADPCFSARWLTGRLVSLYVFMLAI